MEGNEVEGIADGVDVDGDTVGFLLG